MPFCFRNPRSKDEASRSKKRLHVEERNSRANPKRSVTPSKVEVLKSEIAHCPRIPATVEVAFFWFAHCPRIPLPLHSRKLLVFGKLICFCLPASFAVDPVSRPLQPLPLPFASFAVDPSVASFLFVLCPVLHPVAVFDCPVPSSEAFLMRAFMFGR
ncbi:hypothetical protein CRG98_030206 [Punica granatum]|uniref:Uncharacterized protein n=1 Tax=Punica granatum TaxID=22663 RepID=A0A2I0IZH2_PUNGR|nr:hypothetical protein CRG98_030206 [Punica granatum]